MDEPELKQKALLDAPWTTMDGISLGLMGLDGALCPCSRTQPTRSRSTSLGLRSRVAGRRRGALAREGQMRPSLFYYWLRRLWEKGTRLDSPMKGIGDGCQRFMPCHPRQLLARVPVQRDTQRVAVVDPARVQ